MLSVGGRYLSAVSEVPLSPSTGSGTTAAPPGAYKMPGAPRNQRFYVTIPRGVRPGQHFDMNILMNTHIISVFISRINFECAC